MAKNGSMTKNVMIKVFCPTTGQTVLANASQQGPRCTKCGTVGHAPTK
jgi:hypothetical protein